MSAATIIAKTMAEVPRALAAGVVDMATGTLLAAETVDGQPHDGLDQAASAAAELLTGQDLAAVEQAWQRLLGAEIRPRCFEEIVVVSSHRVHIFARLEHERPAALVVVCRTDVDLSVALVKTRAVATSVTV